MSDEVGGVVGCLDTLGPPRPETVLSLEVRRRVNEVQLGVLTVSPVPPLTPGRGVRTPTPLRGALGETGDTGPVPPSRPVGRGRG